MLCVTLKKKSATACLSCTLKMPWLFYIKHFVYVGFISGIQGWETSKWKFSLSFREPKPELGFYFLSLDFYSVCLEEYQIPFCRSPPSDELCVPEFPSFLQFFLASLGEPHSTETLWFWGVFSFLAIIKCFITNLSPCHENAFYLRIENSLIVILNICAQPLLGPCKSSFWEFYSLCSVKCF